MSEYFRKFIPYIAALIMAAVVLIGLMSIGGPAKARAEKNDKARLHALTDTARAVACYRFNLGEMPTDLNVVADAVKNGSSTLLKTNNCRNLKYRTDPITNNLFELVPTSDDSFQICAIFERPGDKISENYRYGGTNFTRHARDVLIDVDKARTEAGRNCYLADGFIQRWAE